MAAKKSTRSSREDSDPADVNTTNDSQLGDVDQQIEELRRKIRTLEERKAAAEFERTALYKNLKAAKGSLDKAVADMDARASMLDTAFIRASRQYLSLLDRALEQARGKKRRGRKPKSDFA